RRGRAAPTAARRHRRAGRRCRCHARPGPAPRSVPAAPATRWRRRRRTTQAATPARVRTGSFGRLVQAQPQPELHVVAHRDAPAVHAVVVAVDGAAGEYVAVARRRLAPGRLDPELLAPLHAADAQD